MHININLTDPPSETILPVSATTCPDSSPRTEPNPPYLYFAYGSNLSPTQMKMRCTVNPSQSGKPLAIALLPKWRWLICEAGYANVLPPKGLRVGTQKSEIAEQVPISGSEDAVYGVLYAMDSADEAILDGYEGIDRDAEEAGGEDVSVEIRPREQGEGDYNKWYLDATIVEWLDDGVHGKGSSGDQVPVLVYVDEERIRLGPPKEEYIGRMNRAIRESVALGVSGKWVDEVMRRFIPE